MPSHPTHLILPRLYFHNFLLGFSAFITLCSLKTLQVMSKSSATKRTCVSWSTNEVHQLLDFLISNASKLADTGGFQTPIFTAASSFLGGDKIPTTIASKWATLKRTYTAIESYRHRSGVHWDNVNGVNIITESEVLAWNTFISTPYVLSCVK